MLFGCFHLNKKKTSLENLPFFNDFKSENLLTFQYFIPGISFFSNLGKKGIKKNTDVFFSSEKKDVLVLFSGQIYNQEDLYKELAFPKKVPTPEFVAKAFKEWGPSFVKKLNGDFAIAIFLSKVSELLLFRDHLGIQPLSYVVHNEEFSFSSDYLHLSRIFCSKEKLQESWLLKNFNITDLEKTPNQKVRKVKPGHFLRVANGKISQEKYWFPEKIKTDFSIDQETAIQELKTLLEDSVRIRSDQRYQAAAHLSGGLDSGLIALLARKNYRDQNLFLGYSYSPKVFPIDNEKKDERNLVNKIAEAGRIEPVFCNLTKPKVLQYLHELHLNYGAFWEEDLLSQAQKENIDIIFSGWGGDQFLSASTAGIYSELFFSLKWRVFKDNLWGLSVKSILRVFIYEIIFPGFGWVNPGSKKDQKERTRYIKKDSKKRNRLEINKIYKFRSRKDFYLNMIYGYSIAERCEDAYVQGFRHGIEYRYPLLDIRIIEYVMKLPTQLLMRKGVSRIIMKEIWKEYLPEKFLLETSKLDFVHYSSYFSMLRELAPDLIKEVSQWKENPDLSFIDFQLLEKDIEKIYKHNEESDNYLERSLYFFKMLHEFTKTYRSLPPTAE
jgi:asparagine synthase (glutamine-hydrolysing)